MSTQDQENFFLLKVTFPSLPGIEELNLFGSNDKTTCTARAVCQEYPAHHRLRQRPDHTNQKGQLKTSLSLKESYQEFF